MQERESVTYDSSEVGSCGGDAKNSGCAALRSGNVDQSCQMQETFGKVDNPALGAEGGAGSVCAAGRVEWRPVTVYVPSFIICGNCGFRNEFNVNQGCTRDANATVAADESDRQHRIGAGCDRIPSFVGPTPDSKGSEREASPMGPMDAPVQGDSRRVAAESAQATKAAGFLEGFQGNQEDPPRPVKQLKQKKKEKKLRKKSSECVQDMDPASEAECPPCTPPRRNAGEKASLKLADTDVGQGGHDAVAFRGHISDDLLDFESPVRHVWQRVPDFPTARLTEKQRFVQAKHADCACEEKSKADGVATPEDQRFVQAKHADCGLKDKEKVMGAQNRAVALNALEEAFANELQLCSSEGELEELEKRHAQDLAKVYGLCDEKATTLWEEIRQAEKQGDTVSTQSAPELDESKSGVATSSTPDPELDELDLR